jgi:alcohol dehydrogenase class IV
VRVWSGPSQEPTPEWIHALAKLAAEHEPDTIVAVGGGSIIDGAKLVRAVYENPALDLTSGKPPPAAQPQQAPQLVAIPTTAGSGAEASQAAVVLDTARHAKIPLVSPSFVPSIVILDPTATATLPAAMTLYSGIDALAHAVEAFVSRISTPLVRLLAATAIRSVLSALPPLLGRLDDLALRETMLDAAYLAGLCQSSASTGLAHALAHPLGALLGVGHAQAAGFLLPRAMRFNAGKNGKPYDELAAAVGFAGRDELVTAVNDWLTSLHVTPDLPTLAGRTPSEEELAAIAAAARTDVCLRTNPCQADERDLESILRETT